MGTEYRLAKVRLAIRITPQMCPLVFVTLELWTPEWRLVVQDC